MKKKAPKLSLSRETLAHLTHSQLEEAAGLADERPEYGSQRSAGG